jgi:hypothetical protein
MVVTVNLILVAALWLMLFAPPAAFACPSTIMVFGGSFTDGQWHEVPVIQCGGFVVQPVAVSPASSPLPVVQSRGLTQDQPNTITNGGECAHPLDPQIVVIAHQGQCFAPGALVGNGQNGCLFGDICPLPGTNGSAPS